MKKHKPNTLLLISSIIGNIYAGILLCDLINKLTTAENNLYGLGQILGTMITAPQVILTIIGVIFKLDWRFKRNEQERSCCGNFIFGFCCLSHYRAFICIAANDTLLCCLFTNEQNGYKIKKSLAALFFCFI